MSTKGYLAWISVCLMASTMLTSCSLIEKCKPPTYSSCEGADLSSIDLFSANLKNANLKNANLRGANLRGADMSGADMSGADLTNADLYGATLIDTDLTNTDLTDTDLIGANLTGADLTNANLTGADLTNADITDANLTNANLTGADLLNARIREAPRPTTTTTSTTTTTTTPLYVPCIAASWDTCEPSPTTTTTLPKLATSTNSAPVIGIPSGGYSSSRKATSIFCKEGSSWIFCTVYYDDGSNSKPSGVVSGKVVTSYRYWGWGKWTCVQLYESGGIKEIFC